MKVCLARLYDPPPTSTSVVVRCCPRVQRPTLFHSTTQNKQQGWARPAAGCLLPTSTEVVSGRCPTGCSSPTPPRGVGKAPQCPRSTSGIFVSGKCRTVRVPGFRLTTEPAAGRPPARLQGRRSGSFWLRPLPRVRPSLAARLPRPPSACLPLLFPQIVKGCLADARSPQTTENDVVTKAISCSGPVVMCSVRRGEGLGTGDPARSPVVERRVQRLALSA